MLCCHSEILFEHFASFRVGMKSVEMSKKPKRETNSMQYPYQELIGDIYASYESTRTVDIKSGQCNSIYL